MPQKPDEHFSEAESSRRRDEVIRRMANTPPQPKASHHPKMEKKADTAHAADKNRVRRGG